MIVLISKE